MKSKLGIWLGLSVLLLQGCASTPKNTRIETMQNFTSAQDLIVQKQLNGTTGTSRAYIYDWGQQQTGAEPESLYPRKYLSQYCHANGGKFSLLHRSNLNLVKDNNSRKILAANSSVKQGIGAYQCDQGVGKSWIVSIEPVAESKSSEMDKAAIRSVNLQTRIMSLEESKNFYSKNNIALNAVSKRVVTNQTSTKNNKHLIEKDMDTKKEVDLKREADAKKELEAKKETKNSNEPQLKSSEKVAETPQSQQLKYYVAARKDLTKGQNQIVACNNAEKAYSYGKLYNTNGSNVYAESGVLVAKCLTHVSAYKSRFSNPKARAVGILQNLATNQNHAGAKNMLKQIQ
ncbi:hypothetical protein IAE19_12670 [Acinetobacter sp. S40]|uniref:hypothetical protein n=1 Tax=Acinetobacter sp. S40 TaxID=2767434 RepID=UPI0019091292|nr:hypothetical protein [Acinetobacter sp. S40]MBJ9986285.1 hypothetical protein [Acinetobacter sp. S40]